jgi:hypothetical protein
MRLETAFYIATDLLLFCAKNDWKTLPLDRYCLDYRLAVKHTKPRLLSVFDD